MNRKQEELGTHILENVRNELYYYFPYLDGAFACISGKGSEETRTIGTDGEFFLFSPEYLLELYVKKPEAVRRGYLHMLLHCLFLHLFKPAGEMWDLACDMAVEQMIERQAQPRLALENAVRKDCFDRMGNEPLPAERILELLEAGAFPYTMEEMRAAFDKNGISIPYNQLDVHIKND